MTCAECGGDGEVTRYSTYRGLETFDCPRCGGSGEEA